MQKCEYDLHEANFIKITKIKNLLIFYDELKKNIL